jgi:hypothetical protein
MGRCCASSTGAYIPPVLDPPEEGSCGGVWLAPAGETGAAGAAGAGLWPQSEPAQKAKTATCVTAAQRVERTAKRTKAMIRREMSFQRQLKRSIEAPASPNDQKRTPQLHPCDPKLARKIRFRINLSMEKQK